MSKHRTKRVRRDWNKVLKYGWSAKAKHKSKSGRTGRVHATKMKSIRAGVA